jgi:predicted nucleic acid-binding protein
MIVVDSSVWIANLRNIDSEPVRKLRSIRNLSQIVVGDLILLEVLQGARDDRHAARIEHNLRRFSVEAMLDAKIAVEAARNYRLLRDQGITIRKTIDMVIATFCLVGSHDLLHDNRDFTPIASHLGLRLF